MEDNAAVQIWSERTQQEKGDNMTDGYVSELWNFTHISMTQNNLQELKKDLILVHPDTKKRVEVFALSIFGLVIFPKVLGHINELKELVVTQRRDNILEEKWMAILQGFQEEDVKWRASWMIPDEILYQCGDFD
ncbi:hypothetical protein Golax_010476 [Gossypium laxum]|uniref:Uncharacterized protein n=1 Tax=Gossypium laxum TaxID=34288 RepID=A0A7J8ZHN3_9ROSI|nr:hypothetical protein [Gossypium laxum]